MNNIPLSIPNISGNELAYVADAIAKQWVSTGGSYIARFEEGFSEYAKVPAATAVQSGTAALHLAMIECGIEHGDFVIAPTLTFVAAINPIRYVGADPLFMGCDDGLCIDPGKLERYICDHCEMRGEALYDKTHSRRVAALLVVHVFGNMADMDRIMDIAERFGLPVIEDATEAVGTFYTAGRYAGRMAGTIGDFGAYSFNGNKIITTGGGGMLVAKDAKKTAHAKYLSTQAKDDETYFVHNEIGFNYRMTNLQAALGVAQLEQLESFIAAKKANYERYNDLGLRLLPFSDSTRPNYWFYSFRSRDRDGLVKHLGERGIQARPVWKLIHTLRMYEQCVAFEIEKAESYHQAVVNIPCSSNLTGNDVEIVATAVREFV